MVISNGTFRYANAALGKMHGFDESTRLQGQFWRVLCDEAQERVLVDDVFPALDQIGQWQGEVRGLRPDGSTFPVELSMTALADGTVACIGRDISARQQDAAALRQAKEAAEQAQETAEQASQAKSAFLSRMSHELRTPLTAILGFAQLLAEDVHPLTADQRDSAEQIRKAGTHLQRLIEEVLDLAQIEAGRLPLDLEPVPLAPQLDEVVALVAPLAVPRRVRLTEQTAGVRDHTVQADPHRLQQVLLNLLTNAIKYSQPGAHVTLTGADSGPGYVSLTVADTGPGIPAEQLAGLFEPFQRLGAEYTEVEGLGIGLGITKRLLELMDGSITVESEIGQGSSFTITLPLAGPETAAAVVPAPAATAAPADGARAEPATHTVLYVEDHPATLDLVERMLQRRPHVKLLTAPQAQLGLELAGAHRPDLIILDINLPGMDGYAALEQLRQQPETHHIPVLALSASAMPQDIERGLAAGFNQYLTKPIDVSVFLTAVDVALAAQP